ncbi:stellacyanin-like, partial [Impatiens glandulifera]|uniref:stellacyanin-like n=1 Tax=Impatiens glandulifera TaxID=253017 RepID=UPI001FB055AF
MAANGSSGDRTAAAEAEVKAVGGREELLLSRLPKWIHVPPSESFQYIVGDDQGWSIPSGSDIGYYNKWASNHRFRVEDTLRFNYKDDSVLVVTQDDYDKCLSTQPIYFSNDGNTTVFTLDSPVMFYFISGVSGHCERGQKMIVKVLEEHETSSSPPPSDETANSSSSSSSSLRLMAPL